MAFYDAHCHLAETARDYNITELLTAASQRGIAGWLSCVQSKEDLHWHQLNKSENILYSAGIHPYHEKGQQLAMADLERLAASGEIFAIGEIGLDKRNRDLQGQVKLLKEQLALAIEKDLFIILHAVGHYDVLYKILSEFPAKGIWHGFNASAETVRQFSRFGLTLSIGHMLITSLKHTTINEIVKYGNFALETDAPYNLKKPSGASPQDLNPLIELQGYLKIAAKMAGVKPESLQRDIEANLKQYIS